MDKRLTFRTKVLRRSEIEISVIESVVKCHKNASGAHAFEHRLMLVLNSIIDLIVISQRTCLLPPNWIIWINCTYMRHIITFVFTFVSSK